MDLDNVDVSLSSLTIKEILRKTFGSSIVCRLIMRGYCILPVLHGAIHCHCDKPLSLECMSRGKLVSSLLGQLQIQVFRDARIRYKIITDHLYLETHKTNLKNILRLFVQFDIDIKVFIVGNMALLVGSVSEMIKQISLVTGLNKHTVRVNICKELMLYFRNGFHMITIDIGQHSRPNPERCETGWKCWWMVAICPCKHSCNCGISFWGSVVSDEAIKLAINGKLLHPVSLIKYIKTWFMLNESRIISVRRDSELYPR